MRRLVFHRRKNSFLLGFLLSYVAVLLLPIFLCLFIYTRTVGIMKANAQESNMAMLEQIRHVLDERFMEIDNAVTQLSGNPDVLRLQYVEDPLGGVDAFKVRTAIESLKQYLLRSNCIDEIYIYFMNSDIIISSGSAFIRLPLYYEGSFRYGEMDYEAWHSTILQGYYRKRVFPAAPAMRSDGKESSTILYVQSLPLDNYRPPISGNIIVMIRDSEIARLLGSLNVADGGWAYIADGSGNVITSLAGDGAELLPVSALAPSAGGIMQYSGGGAEMTVTYTKSTYNGFTYVAAFPNTVIMENTRTVSTMITVLMVFSILSALLLACYLAYRNSAPYRSIFDTLRSIFKDGEPAAGGYEFIKGGLSRLVENNADLANSVERQLPLVRSAFYNRLLHGEFKNASELNAAMGQVGLSIRSRLQNVAIVRLDGYGGAALAGGVVNRDALKELSDAMEIIKTAVTFIHPHDLTLYPHSLESGSIALIVFTDADITPAAFDEAADGQLRLLYDRLHNQHRLQVTIAAGNACENLYDLFCSYYEARQAVESLAGSRHGPVVWYRDIPKDSLSYYYPIEIETRLMNLIKAGNAEGAGKLIDEIHRENAAVRALTPEMSRQIVFELKGTLIRVIDQVAEHGSPASQELHAGINALNAPGGIGEMFERFRALADELCAWVNRGKTSRKAFLMQGILRHVDGSYGDCNLCLASVAAQFGISEAYLCQLFKEQTGGHFSSHLTDVRLKHACGLLSSTDLSINDVAARVGFNSAHSFRRSFKRVIGVTPYEYRAQKPVSV